MSTTERDDVAETVLEPTVGAGAQIALLLALSAGVGLGPMGWLAGLVYTAVSWGVLVRSLRRSGASAPGPADRVTLTRAVLVGGVTALVADRADATALIVALAATALVLDAVDGLVARRTGTVSLRGARFDMEVDAFLLLVLSAHLAESMGAWVLAIGLMRYAFVAIAALAPWMRSPLPPSTARKTVAAVQGIVLVSACAEPVPDLVATVAVTVALVLLTWSFGRDVQWLWRTSAQSSVRGW